MTYELKMPILGFDDVTKVELEQIDETFSKLRSLDGTRPFEITLVNPFSLCEYNFTIPTADEKLLDLDETRGDKVLVFCVVVVQKPIENSIVNLILCLIQAMLLACRLQLCLWLNIRNLAKSNL